MQIDHLIHAVPDLDAGVEDVERRLGVRAAGGGRHPGMGTHNRLLGLGPQTYLEIIAPDPDQPEPDGPRPYGVDGQTGAGLVGWALTCDDIESARATAVAQGFDPGAGVEAGRVTPTGTTLRWRVTSNASPAGLIPFLISWGDSPHPAASAPPGLTLASFHLEHPDAERLAAPLHALGAQADVRRAPEAALVARIDGPHGLQELR